MNVIGQSGVEVSHGCGSWRQVRELRREVVGVVRKMNGSDCGGSGSRDSTTCGLLAIACIDVTSRRDCTCAFVVNSRPVDVGLQDARKTARVVQIIHAQIMGPLRTWPRTDCEQIF